MSPEEILAAVYVAALATVLALCWNPQNNHPQG